MSAEPITHGGADRRWKLCKCSKCDCVETCTPSFDFYTTEENGPLLCEVCFWRKVNEQQETKP